MSAVHVNGTQAKDIALYFMSVTNQKDSKKIPHTVNIAKKLLQKYEYDVIIGAIDYLVARTNIYSLGYLLKAMDEVLPVITRHQIKDEVRAELERVSSQQRNEVRADDESAERNRNKAGRFGVQSRFGAKFNFDMFEGH